MTIDWVENLVRQMANYPAAEVFDVVEVGGPGGPDEYRDFIVVGPAAARPSPCQSTLSLTRTGRFKLSIFEAVKRK